MTADHVFSFTTIAAPDTAPAVAGTTPSNGAIDVAVNANIDVTFTEDVSVGSWYDISCSTSGNHPAVTTGDATKAAFIISFGQFWFEVFAGEDFFNDFFAFKDNFGFRLYEFINLHDILINRVSLSHCHRSVVLSGKDYREALKEALQRRLGTHKVECVRIRRGICRVKR